MVLKHDWDSYVLYLPDKNSILVVTVLVCFYHIQFIDDCRFSLQLCVNVRAVVRGDITGSTPHPEIMTKKI